LTSGAKPPAQTGKDSYIPNIERARIVPESKENASLSLDAQPPGRFIMPLFLAIAFLSH